LSRFETCKIRVEGKFVQKGRDSAGMPPAAASLEPAQMSTEGSSQKNGVGILSEFFVGKSFLDSNLETVSSLLRCPFTSFWFDLQDHQWLERQGTGF
jgi:hypothetical protein